MDHYGKHIDNRDAGSELNRLRDVTILSAVGWTFHPQSPWWLSSDYTSEEKTGAIKELMYSVLSKGDAKLFSFSN